MRERGCQYFDQMRFLFPLDKKYAPFNGKQFKSGNFTLFDITLNIQELPMYWYMLKSS